MSNRTNQRPPIRKWTEAEDEVLITEIGTNPLNLRLCFIAAATKLHRTPNACASHWYAYLSQSTKRDKTAIITIGRKTAFRNKKRYKEGTPSYRVRTGVFLRLLRSLFGDNEDIV